ncbi:MAG: glycogen/starch synthase [Bacteroidetes bacterium]|nr:glycogen/starch synthase [Bacteroidota bacterium]MCL6102618.1 glycogen/starch synthase [Bacteroidota bacterium]
MEKKKVLFISQEITPYLPESEIAEISRYLPQGIQERGKEIRTFMPRFGNVNERRNQLHEVIRLSGMNLIINDNDHPLIIKVASIQAARMQVYFIDNEDYFQRKYSLRDENNVAFDDNDERAIFFARGVLETVIKLRWSPDIIHCHGWFTGMVPLFVKKTYKDNPLFANTRIVYSVYNDQFERPLSSDMARKIAEDGIDLNDISVLNEPTFENYTKLALAYSDAAIQGSEVINERIGQHIKASGMQFLDYQSKESYIDAYFDFYNKIL